MARYLLKAHMLDRLTPRRGCKLTKYSDGDGLYFWVSTSPRSYKRWYFHFMYNGIRKDMLIGSYPEMSAGEARELAEKAREQVRKGINPIEARRSAAYSEKNRREHTFKAVAEEWFKNMRVGKISESTLKKDRASLENDVYPYIGNRPIDEITPTELLDVIKRVEARCKGDTNQRVKNRCCMIFRYACNMTWCKTNPAENLTDMLQKPEYNNFPAIKDMKRFAELLRAIDGYNGFSSVKICLKLAPYLGVRPCEIRFARWGEFDFEKKEWHYVTGKKHYDHIVPLSNQAIELLKEQKLKSYENDQSLVFPSVAREKTRPLSDNTINAAIETLGFGEEQKHHGFRATLETNLRELGYPGDWIDIELSHRAQIKYRGAYNRADYLEQRHKMMQQWADYICEAKVVGADLDTLKQKYTFRF